MGSGKRVIVNDISHLIRDLIEALIERNQKLEDQLKVLREEIMNLPNGNRDQNQTFEPEVSLTNR